jgi:predicted ABC-type transport system involved in lysophospholipase L1 biosynthesis ATPase subunit
MQKIADLFFSQHHFRVKQQIDLTHLMSQLSKSDQVSATISRLFATSPDLADPSL